MKKNLSLVVLLLSVSVISLSQGFKISGSQLLDANGTNFIMKGFAVPTAWFVNDVNTNIANIKARTGSNCLRIVVTTSSADADWQTCVANCIANKMIPMVELHDVTGNNSPSELNRMAQWWATKAAYLTRPDIAKYILINIANEWSDWFMSATATGPVSRVTWRDAYIVAVKTLRDAGIKTTLVVDAAGYGQDNMAQTILGFAKDVQAADALHNCLFSVHMYCEWKVGGGSNVATLLPSIKTAGIPIIVGEFGFQHTEGGGVCDIDESTIINTANTSGIGWLAWSWKGNGGGVEYLDLSTDWGGLSLSAWGNTVVNGAGGTKTALTASVFSGTTPPPNVPPTVSLSAPMAGATFAAPATINITATAADTDGSVASVQFFNGTTLLGTDATAPYSFTWTPVTAGAYNITAKATDNLGAVTTSTAVAITVTGVGVNLPPTVSLSSPLNGATFIAPASVTINANAADADGTVSNVQFFNGATLLASDATAPYSFVWTPVAAGSYTLTAKATDNTGAITTSTAVMITVNPVVITTADIIGPDCGVNNTTLSFSLNPAKRTNVTSYNWWYTGSVASTTIVAGSPFSATIQTGGNFSSGQVCVGTNLSAAPWYASYCKTIAKCAAVIKAPGVNQQEAIVLPNPTASSYTLLVPEAVQAYTISNYLGAIVMEGRSISKGASIRFGAQLSRGNYILQLRYKNGRIETKHIQKIQ